MYAAAPRTNPVSPGRRGDRILTRAAGARDRPQGRMRVVGAIAEQERSAHPERHYRCKAAARRRLSSDINVTPDDRRAARAPHHLHDHAALSAAEFDVQVRPSRRTSPNRSSSRAIRSCSSSLRTARTRSTGSGRLRPVDAKFTSSTISARKLLLSGGAEPEVRRHRQSDGRSARRGRAGDRIHGRPSRGQRSSLTGLSTRMTGATLKPCPFFFLVY